MVQPDYILCVQGDFIVMFNPGNFTNPDWSSEVDQPAVFSCSQVLLFDEHEDDCDNHDDDDGGNHDVGGDNDDDDCHHHDDDHLKHHDSP